MGNECSNHQGRPEAGRRTQHRKDDQQQGDEPERGQFVPLKSLVQSDANEKRHGNCKHHLIVEKEIGCNQQCTCCQRRCFQLVTDSAAAPHKRKQDRDADSHHPLQCPG